MNPMDNFLSERIQTQSILYNFTREMQNITFTEAESKAVVTNG